MSRDTTPDSCPKSTPIDKSSMYRSPYTLSPNYVPATCARHMHPHLHTTHPPQPRRSRPTLHIYHEQHMRSQCITLSKPAMSPSPIYTYRKPPQRLVTAGATSPLRPRLASTSGSVREHHLSTLVRLLVHMREIRAVLVRRRMLPCGLTTSLFTHNGGPFRY
jgi:hypothetical protein